MDIEHHTDDVHAHPVSGVSNIVDAVRTIGRRCKKIIKWSAALGLTSALAVMSLCGLASWNAVRNGDNRVSEDIKSYAVRNNIDLRMFEGVDHKNIRVYRMGDIETVFHRAGTATRREFERIGKSHHAPEIKPALSIMMGALTYALELPAAGLDYLARNNLFMRYNARTLPVKSLNQACYILPNTADDPDEFFVLSGVITGARFSDHRRFLSAAILAHEAKHCDHAALVSRSRLRPSFSLAAENESDNNAMRNLKAVYGDAAKGFIEYYAAFRALRPFAGDGRGDFSHATALAFTASSEIPQRPMDVRAQYYGNMQLSEEVDARLESTPYLLHMDRSRAVYNVMKEVVQEKGNPNISPAMRQAAQAYVDAIDYLDRVSFAQNMSRQMIQDSTLFKEPFLIMPR